MQISNWIIFLVLLVFLGVYLSNVAGRLDRLHLKVENARNALDRQLAIRSAVCRELVNMQEIDSNFRNKLNQAIQDSINEESLEVHSINEWQIESNVTKILKQIFDNNFSINLISNKKIVEEIAAASRRVQYALTFYNDAANGAIVVRKRWVVRFFRLFGRASMPEVIEFDAEIPQGLAHL